MGSLSFENIFPSEPGDRSERAGWPPRKVPVSWSNPSLAALPAARTLSEASPWAISAMRRVLDFSLAGTALIALSPVMAFAAALVRFGSPGPILFRQRRMGRNGKEFTLYKFRSMREEYGTSTCITVSGDSRITPVGAFLRRYKLDELPQFWNVLRGDMGLVGPRPKLPHHEALHMTYRPGITGAATLAFRNEEELLSQIPETELEIFYESFVKPAKAHLDSEYMRAASPVSDLKILWRTGTSCLFSPARVRPEAAEVMAQFAWARGGASKVEHSAVAAGEKRACVARFNPEM